MEQITEEQKKEIRKISAKFALRSSWNGIHHGFMAIAMNVVFIMAMMTFFDKDTAASSQFFGSVAIGIFVLNRCFRIQRQNMIDFKESISKILKK